MPQTLVEVWQANAAGRYTHKVDAAPCAARSELLRRRPDDHRRRGALSVRHDQARRVSVEQPPQRLAAGAHPLLAVRHQLPDAADHADVFPGRSAAAARSDLQLDPRRARARSGWSPSSISTSTEPEWALGFTFDIVLRGSQRDADGGREMAVSPRSRRVGPFFDFGLMHRDGGQSSPRPRRPAGTSSIEGSVRDGAGDALPGRDHRSLAGQRRRQVPASGGSSRTCRSIPRATASAASRPTSDGRFAFTTVMPGRVPGPDGRCRRRIWSSACSPAAFSRDWSTRHLFRGRAVERRGSRARAGAGRTARRR